MQLPYRPVEHNQQELHTLVLAEHTQMGVHILVQIEHNQKGAHTLTLAEHTQMGVHILVLVEHISEKFGLDNAYNLNLAAVAVYPKAGLDRVAHYSQTFSPLISWLTSIHHAWHRSGWDLLLVQQFFSVKRVCYKIETFNSYRSIAQRHYTASSIWTQSQRESNIQTNYDDCKISCNTSRQAHSISAEIRVYS